MVEVRVTFRLSNAADDIMAKRKKIDEASVPRLDVEMVVDTGAVMVFLPQDMVDQARCRRDRGARHFFFGKSSWAPNTMS
jgi:hypothetical protein